MNAQHSSRYKISMEADFVPMYIARVYEKIIDRKKMYQKNLEKIPTPEFVVLYNGKAPQPDHETLKLSEAFKDAAQLKAVAPDTPALELVVQVYNINPGHNTALCTRSETLGGYSIFVDKIREYEKSMPLEAAMREAIKYCIENGVLKTFLETHSSEVFNMLITEWNTEEAKKVWYEEGREEGLSDVARTALAEGASIEFVQKITGLDIETIKNLALGQQ
jgi:hypothetical protein